MMRAPVSRRLPLLMAHFRCYLRIHSDLISPTPPPVSTSSRNDARIIQHMYVSDTQVRTGVLKNKDAALRGRGTQSH